MLGMGLQYGAAFTPPMLMSLVGHLAYGLITGVVCVGIAIGKAMVPPRRRVLCGAAVSLGGGIPSPTASSSRG
jgi:hypothetical protein